MSVVAVTGLTKRFGDKTVVDAVDLTVEEGEIVGFLGPNGSGKTTTIRLLCGLLKPDAGAGTCLGHDILKESDRIKAEIGYMTQRFSFYEDLTIEENLAFVARLFGLSPTRAHVGAALDRLGIASRRRQLAGELSGGWKQRLALAACIMHKPRLLMLDEPTAGVDPKARREFWDEVHALSGEGVTVLVSTHYMDEAERCHRIVYIAYGRIVARGTAEEVIATSGLATWVVAGRGLAELARALRSRPGIEQATAFGTTLHVTGSDPVALERAIAPYRAVPGTTWTRGATNLEDVFIRLMSEARDQYG